MTSSCSRGSYSVSRCFAICGRGSGAVSGLWAAGRVPTAARVNTAPPWQERTSASAVGIVSLTAMPATPQAARGRARVAAWAAVSQRAWGVSWCVGS